MVETQDQYLKELNSLYWDNGHNPEPTQMERLAYFAELVAGKNGSLNLVSKRDLNSLIEKHIFISAFATRFIPERVTQFLDIGTGGGFPGIPLGIMRPGLKGVLADSTAKKAKAVNEFVDKLKLGNITVENQRVESEEFIKKYNDTFDLVVSRATVPLIILLRYSIPLIKDRAYLAAMKGGDLNEEFKKAEMKYKSYIKKSTFFELNYKPSNPRNEMGKKLVLLELVK